MKTSMAVILALLVYSSGFSQRVSYSHGDSVVLEYEHKAGDIIELHRARTSKQDPIQRDTIVTGSVRVRDFMDNEMICDVVSLGRDTSGKEYGFSTRDLVLGSQSIFRQHVIAVPTKDRPQVVIDVGLEEGDVLRIDRQTKEETFDTLFVKGIGIAKDDVLKTRRATTKDTTVGIGFVKIQSIESGRVRCEVTGSMRGNRIQEGDVVGAKRSSLRFYLEMGLLNGGAYATKNFLGIDLRQLNGEVKLHYPDNTAMLNIGVLGNLVKSGALRMLGGFGFPFKKMQMTVRIGSVSETKSLDLVSFNVNTALVFYPAKMWQSGDRVQPFLQGGIGVNFYADSWGTILLLGLTNPGSTEGSQLVKRVSLQSLLWFGGGMDVYLSESTGLRLSFLKHKFDIPGIEGSISPIEIRLGVIEYLFGRD